MPTTPSLLSHDGLEQACCTGVRWRALDLLGIESYSRDAPKELSYTFAVKDDWFFNRGEPKSDDERDYHLWRTHLEKVFDIELVQVTSGKPGIYWKTPVVNYNQLVFIATLIRQPVELNGGHPGYVRVYQYMIDNKVDPMGALVGLTIDMSQVKEGRDLDRWYVPGPFYNSTGHGLAEVGVALAKRFKYDLHHFRRLDAKKALKDLATTRQSCGNTWGSEVSTPGFLDQPREYVVADSKAMEKLTTKKPRVRKPKAKLVPLDTSLEVF